MENVKSVAESFKNAGFLIKTGQKIYEKSITNFSSTERFFKNWCKNFSLSKTTAKTGPKNIVSAFQTIQNYNFSASNSSIIFSVARTFEEDR